MQTNAVIVYLNLSIETSFPCIPTQKVREEVGAYSRGGEALFCHYEIGGRHLFGEGHLLGRGRLVEEIRYSLIVPFFRTDIILFKVSDELLYFAQ